MHALEVPVAVCELPDTGSRQRRAIKTFLRPETTTRGKHKFPNAALRDLFSSVTRKHDGGSIRAPRAFAELEDPNETPYRSIV